MQRTSLLMLLLVGVAGCAGLTVKPVPDAAADTKARGFRYYEPSPYLLVYTDNKGGLVTKLVYLPDTTKKMSAQPYNLLASNEVTLDFEDGMLKSGKTVVDETVVPKAVVAAVEKAALAAIAAKGAPGPSKKNPVPSPYLFKIVRDKNGVYSLNGGAAEENGKTRIFHVTIGNRKKDS